MASYKIVFRAHAARRLLERKIAVEDVERIVVGGAVIETYPTDEPFASRLVFGWAGERPLHIVAADDDAAGVTYIVTVYEPGVDQWSDDFKRRRT